MLYVASLSNCCLFLRTPTGGLLRPTRCIKLDKERASEPFSNDKRYAQGNAQTRAVMAPLAYKIPLAQNE